MKDFEWCHDCKEYDNERHCCPRWTKVIRTTLNDSINVVLDEIRAEIDEQYDRVHSYNISCAEGLEMALEIIDKHKEGESE